jgi:hypothetical protein
MDITIVVLAAAVMAVPTLILVDVPTLILVDVPILTLVDAQTVAVTTIPIVKMMTN